MVAKSKRAASKAKRATKTTAAKQKKAAAKRKSPSPKKAAAKRTTKKAAAKRKSPRARARASTPARARAQSESVVAENVSGGDEAATPTEAKKGPLARLADGVGNLIARMTAKKEPAAADPNQTIELASDDIMPATDAPPIPKPRSDS
jgi:hypothetical protein